MNNSNSKFIVATVAIFFIVVVLAVITFFLTNKTNNMQMFTTPTPFVPTGAMPDRYNVIDQKTRQQIDQSYAVSKIISQLPYRGANFTLYFSFTTAQFTLYLNPANEQSGNQEFDAFLKQNGIADRSWVQNLVITTNPATPLP